jgi:hypothetical protein
MFYFLITKKRVMPIQRFSQKCDDKSILKSFDDEKSQEIFVVIFFGARILVKSSISGQYFI